MGKQFNRRKDSAYKYGLWAIDHIPFLSDDVTTYNELKNLHDIGIIRTKTDDVKIKRRTAQEEFVMDTMSVMEHCYTHINNSFDSFKED